MDRKATITLARGTATKMMFISRPKRTGRAEEQNDRYPAHQLYRTGRNGNRTNATTTPKQPDTNRPDNPTEYASGLLQLQGMFANLGVTPRNIRFFPDPDLTSISVFLD